MVCKAVGSLPRMHTSRRRVTLRLRESRLKDAETMETSRNSGGRIQPEVVMRRRTSSVAATGQVDVVGSPLMAPGTERTLMPERGGELEPRWLEPKWLEPKWLRTFPNFRVFS